MSTLIKALLAAWMIALAALLTPAIFAVTVERNPRWWVMLFLSMYPWVLATFTPWAVTTFISSLRRNYISFGRLLVEATIPTAITVTAIWVYFSMNWPSDPIAGSYLGPLLLFPLTSTIVTAPLSVLLLSPLRRRLGLGKLLGSHAAGSLRASK